MVQNLFLSCSSSWLCKVSCTRPGLYELTVITVGLLSEACLYQDPAFITFIANGSCQPIHVPKLTTFPDHILGGWDNNVSLQTQRQSPNTKSLSSEQRNYRLQVVLPTVAYNHAAMEINQYQQMPTNCSSSEANLGMVHQIWGSEGADALACNTVVWTWLVTSHGDLFELQTLLQ